MFLFVVILENKKKLKMKKLLFTALLLGGVLSVQACTEKEKKDNNLAETKVEAEKVITSKDAPTIVGVAAGNENFSTLVAAVKAAELVETLNGDGPFTVFAPTNAAFEKLPENTVSDLLKPENKDTLTAILTYHVVAGNYKAADVVKAIKDNNGSFTITTVQGATLTASMDGENVILTDAKGGTSTIIMTDVAAANGVIHAIDTVVMP